MIYLENVSQLKSYYIVILIVMLGLMLPGSSIGEEDSGVDLDQYLDLIQQNHPYFKQQQIRSDIEKNKLSGLKGDTDWQLNHSSTYVHEEHSDTAINQPQELDFVDTRTSFDRLSWDTGGVLSIQYRHAYSDQYSNNLRQDFEQYDGGLSVSYRLPLMKNRQGVLSRLNYDLQQFNIELSQLTQYENLEAFLEQQGLLFLDWVFVDEQRQIALKRLKIANQELKRTKRKRSERLVADIDVLSARDAVLNAEMFYERVHAEWKGFQAELAQQSASDSLYQSKPKFDLYHFQEVAPLHQVRETLQQQARVLESVDVQIKQNQKRLEANENQLKPNVELFVGAGLGNEDESFGDSLQMNQPRYQAGISVNYPLGNRSAKADLKTSRLVDQELAYSRQTLFRQMDAQLHNISTQLTELKKVLALNKRQMTVAKARTKEELKRHNQGKSELSFVLQSRDNEQNVMLNYAANAITYQKLWLSYQSLTDLLLSVE